MHELSRIDIEVQVHFHIQEKLYSDSHNWGSMTKIWCSLYTLQQIAFLLVRPIGKIREIEQIGPYLIYSPNTRSLPLAAKEQFPLAAQQHSVLQ